MQIEAKLQEKGLVLPQGAKLPPGITISFAWARRHGNRIYELYGPDIGQHARTAVGVAAFK